MDYTNNPAQPLQSQLSAGESLAWSGRPRQGIVVRGSDAFMIPFSLLWGGFAVFWEYTAWSSGAPAFFLLFGGVFVVVGIYFVLGRFIVDAIYRGSTYYGVTNERVLIYRGFPSKTTKSLSLSTLSDITLTTKSDGSGTITFGPQMPMAAMMQGMRWPGADGQVGPMLDLIPDAQQVYDIIQRKKRDRRD